jgi:hypothetical protein
MISLSQQLVVVLEEAPPRSTLDFSNQAAFAMKALVGGLQNYRTAALTVQRVVVIAAQFGLIGVFSHGRGSEQQLTSNALSIGALSAFAYYQNC